MTPLDSTHVFLVHQNNTDHDYYLRKEHMDAANTGTWAVKYGHNTVVELRCASIYASDSIIYLYVSFDSFFFFFSLNESTGAVEKSTFK
jgi:hypothetical protein